MKVVWADEAKAKAHLDGIYQYIKRDSLPLLNVQ